MLRGCVSSSHRRRRAVERPNDERRGIKSGKEVSRIRIRKFLVSPPAQSRANGSSVCHLYVHVRDVRSDQCIGQRSGQRAPRYARSCCSGYRFGRAESILVNLSGSPSFSGGQATYTL
jgi:hypothetical protein